MKAIKEIEYLYNNMTTCETIRLKPHLEVIEKEILELLSEHEENTKKLKALEIIKEKQIDVLYIDMFPNSLDKYNKHVSFIKHSKWCLTQEEFDLLKEVLL